MRESTTIYHERVADLGRSLGFVVGREISNSLLRVRLDEGYRPRVDLLWSLPLVQSQIQAIAWAIERDTCDVTHLPVVGIEVEGSMPTTKTLAADVANLTALGAPLGLLIVSEMGERNIYRRAVRAIRSIRRAYGDLKILPMEAEWLTSLLQIPWRTGLSILPSINAKAKKPSGGETRAWCGSTRDILRKRGEDAGFTVVEPYVPAALAEHFRLANQLRAQPMTHTTDPIAKQSARMTSDRDYLTRCQIDLAWLLPLPASVSEFLGQVLSRDECVAMDGIVFPDQWTHLPVVAFEIESGGGKHAGGALLNLNAYSVLGISVAPNDVIAKQVEATLRTYRPTLGLRNVFVKTLI